jgi:hypothetical protein
VIISIVAAIRFNSTTLVILSEAKDLLLLAHADQQQIPRSARNDKADVYGMGGRACTK